jgi:hypothetical protein
MSIICSSCNSHRIIEINLAKRTAGTVGVLGGIASGLTLASGAARTAITVASMSNPITAFGGLLLSGMASGIAGGIIGSALGEVVDDNILDNYECLSCGHIFSQKPD